MGGEWTDRISFQHAILPHVLSGQRLRCVSKVLYQVDDRHVPVVGGADEIIHPRIIGVNSEVNLEVSEDSREGLEVEEKSLSQTFLLELRLSVSDKLLDVEN